MKKKVISILLTAVLATGMAACGSNSNTAGNSANNTADNAPVSYTHLTLPTTPYV